jgi:hypothetical protein
MTLQKKASQGLAGKVLAETKTLCTRIMAKSTRDVKHPRHVMPGAERRIGRKPVQRLTAMRPFIRLSS